MMTEEQRSLLRTYGTLAGRVFLGLLFVFTAVGFILGGTDAVASMIANKGLPFAGLITWIVIVVKILSGAALILGYRVGYAAGALIVFTALTILFFHMDFRNDVNFFKNLAIIGGLFYVMAYGAGDGWKLGAQRSPVPSM